MATAEQPADDRPTSRASSIDKERANVLSQESEAGDEPSQEDTEFRKKEVKVVTKLDIYVCPILIALQLLSFLDRGNIGPVTFLACRAKRAELITH